MAITKREALSIVYQCAKKYKSELINHSLLFICADKHMHTYAIEVTFDASNFLHLTGFQTRDKGISSGDFFQRCIDKRLSENDFDFATDGTTSLKLDVLPQLVSRNLSAKMIGDYNGSQPKLYTEKLAGNVVGCIGFIKDKKTQRYVPNTVLKGRTDDYTAKADRIMVTYRKAASETKYTEIVYAAKKVAWQEIRFPTGYEDLPLPAVENHTAE